MSNDWNQGFSMPMFRGWVPEKLRPWLYVYLAFTFQLCSGVYLGGMEHIRGSLDLKHEDVMMCLYATLCGLALYFPMLFRTKFRFTNRSLLMFSATGIAVLSVVSLYVTLLPALWIICFVVGALKLQGTFECMSNIQLWMTPKRDFAVFFPILHIFIMCSICVSDILAVYLSYYATWHYMNYLMAGVMLFNGIWIGLLTKPVRTMPKMPLLAIDWLGLVLWATVVLQLAFIFCYGDFYDWWISPVIRTVSCTLLLTLTLALIRMMMIRHPYIEPKIFLSKGLSKFLLVALVVEMVMATEHVIEGVFFAAGPHWDSLQRSWLNVPVMAGVLGAVVFSLLWLKVLQWKASRLMAVGMAVFAGYSLWFYFNIASIVELEHLYVPMFLRGFATTMMGITMLYIVKSLVHFMVFFQALSVFQCLHLIIGGVIGAAIYTFGVKYFMGDHLALYGGAFDATTFSLATQGENIGHVMDAMQLATAKRLYGIVAYVALTAFLLILLWDIPLTRGIRQRIPSWGDIRRGIGKRLSRLSR